MQTPQQVLENEFLEVRCMLIETAAVLDRYDRATQRETETTRADQRLEKIYESLALLANRNATADRSERLLNLFTESD